MAYSSPRDDNRIPAIFGVSDLDGVTPLPLLVDHITGRLLVSAIIASGSGITSLNGLTGATQTFASVNDTNVTLGIVSAGTTHTFTMGWTGILAAARGGTANAFFQVLGPAASAKTFTFPNASATVLTDAAAVTVAQGGTGDTSLTAYAVLCGGTTSTGAIQSVAGLGAAGTVLTSNGAGALPTFQAVSAGTVTGSGSAGQAAFWTGASALSGDNSFFWDNTNKRLGLGNATPATTLDITGNQPLNILQNAVATGTPTLAVITGGAHTNLTLSTEVIAINFNLAQTVQWATGAIATQRAMYIQAPTYAFVGASTISDATTLEISSAPTAGTNATITRPWALRIPTGGTLLRGTNPVGGNLHIGSGTSAQQGAALYIAKGVYTTTTNVEQQNITSVGTTQTLNAAGTTNNSSTNEFTAATITASSAKNITNVSTVQIDGAPNMAGAGPAAAANASALYIGGITFGAGATTQTSAAALLYSTILVNAVTVTLLGSTNVTTNPAAQVYLGIMTLSAASALTYTAAATLYVAGAPVGGGAGPATLTNGYAIWIAGGLIRSDATAALVVGGANITTAHVVDISRSAPTTSTEIKALQVGGYSITRSGNITNQRLASFGQMIIGGAFTTTTFSTIDIEMPNRNAGTVTNFFGIRFNGGTNSTINGAANYANIGISNGGVLTVGSTNNTATQGVTNINIESISISGSAVITHAAAINIMGVFTGGTITSIFGIDYGGAHTQVSAAAFVHAGYNVNAHTITMTGTTQVTSTVGVAGVYVNQITITDGSALTINGAASVYIDNAPLAAGSVTLTNTYSLWVNQGNVRIGGGATASELRFMEPSGSGVNFTAWKAQAQGSDITYTLPATQGAANTFLKNDGSGGLSWAASTGSGYKAFLAVRVANAGNATVAYAHGLGTTPTRIRITMVSGAGSAPSNSDGVWDGTNMFGVYQANAVPSGSTAGTMSALVEYADIVGTEIGTAGTIDATNVNIVWTATGSPGAGSLQMLIEVFA